MKVIPQKIKLSVSNHDDERFISQQNGKHGELFPNTVRCIICGPSNCGKTNAMFSLLTDDNGLRFCNVYVYSKSLNQPKYKLLEEILRPIDHVGYYTFSDNDLIMTPNEANPNSIFIFDDIACEKQNNIRAYFSMGRHNAIDCFYLGQTYSKIPKQLIRDNANFLILFEQDETNMRHIYNDHVSPSISICKFKEICGNCWSEPHGFLAINKDAEIKNGRFRKGFDHYIIP